MEFHLSDIWLTGCPKIVVFAEEERYKESKEMPRNFVPCTDQQLFHGSVGKEAIQAATGHLLSDENEVARKVGAALLRLQKDPLYGNPFEPDTPEHDYFVAAAKVMGKFG